MAKERAKTARNISLLDCTLRDGGYVNDWLFGHDALDAVPGVDAEAAQIQKARHRVRRLVRLQLEDDLRPVCHRKGHTRIVWHWLALLFSQMGRPAPVPSYHVSAVPAMQRLLFRLFDGKTSSRLVYFDRARCNIRQHDPFHFFHRYNTGQPFRVTAVLYTDYRAAGPIPADCASVYRKGVMIACSSSRA